MAKLNAEQEMMAKCWLNDIFQASGFALPDSDIRDTSYWLMHKAGRPSVTTSAKQIIDTITARKFDNIDSAFDNLSNYSFGFEKNSHRFGRKKAEMLAKYVAWFCNKAKLYWDNSLLTQEEMSEFLNTYLGKALNEYDCFATSKDATGSSSSRTRATVTKVPGAGPVIGYKSSGPHSEHIVNLVGDAHEKIMFNDYAYCIIADRTGKNLPNAFITPLSSDGSSYTQSRAEKVNMGSGNGYTDCTCWFKDTVSADAFCLKCREAFGDKFTGINVGRKSPDANGYFEVTTEFGNAYIKASKLNEQLQSAENLTEADCKIEESSKGYTIEANEYLDLFKNKLHRD